MIERSKKYVCTCLSLPTHVYTRANWDLRSLCVGFSASLLARSPTTTTTCTDRSFFVFSFSAKGTLTLLDHSNRKTSFPPPIRPPPPCLLRSARPAIAVIIITADRVTLALVASNIYCAIPRGPLGVEQRPRARRTFWIFSHNSRTTGGSSRACVLQ